MASIVPDNLEFEAQAASENGRYAVALHVENRVCVVVGGGTVGERKARELQAAGARVVVVAPQLSAALQADASAGRIHARLGNFDGQDLDDAFLVIAATDDAAVNQRVLDEAARRKVLANRAAAVAKESAGAGDFDTMATVRRGDLLIGVTTGGAGPAIAARIKSEIAATWGPEWGAWTALLGQVRRQAQNDVADAGLRADVLRRLAARDDLRARLAESSTGDTAVLNEVREEAERMLRAAVAQSLEAESVCPAR